MENNGLVYKGKQNSVISKTVLTEYWSLLLSKDFVYLADDTETRKKDLMWFVNFRA